jgi:hypothetical protein
MLGTTSRIPPTSTAMAPAATADLLLRSCLGDLAMAVLYRLHDECDHPALHSAGPLACAVGRAPL